MLGFENPEDPWFLQRLASTLLVFALFTAGHVYVTMSNVDAGMCASEGLRVKDSDCSDLQLNLREELLRARMLQARIEMMKKVHAVMIHFSFLYNLTAIWNFICDPRLFSLCELLAIFIYYLVFVFAHGIVRTEVHFRIYEAFVIGIHALFLLGILGETDLVAFDMFERLCTIGTICTSMFLIDLQVTLPFFFCQQAVLIYCRWNLMGLDRITPSHAFSTVFPNIIVGAVIALCTHLIRSNIEAKVDSGDAASLIRAFRQILRGVCDGGFILDRHTMTIVDDASSLEHALKSNRRLANSCFLDLFLDSEGRESFCKFVAADSSNSESIPRGFRVSLQGARGAVSMDLFYTALALPGASSDYCLLAIKEDPESSVPPDAPRDSLPKGIPAMPMSDQTRSSVSELLVAYDDLVEVALLVSDVTGLLDVEEVHLSFQRKSAVSNIESGMPTLRRFIRPFDWDRIEHMFNVVVNLPPSEQQQRCYFTRPTLFRVPGESRSYLCARSTSLSLADHSVVWGRPTRFWMHLSQFDSSQILRVPQQELEGIAEEQ